MSTRVKAQAVVKLARQPARVPHATYRLQFHAGFTFNDARKIVPYLAELGISHLYASPYFQANPGSTHGYDVTDYTALNPEIGTQAEYDTLIETLHTHGMGQLLDFVPNHMGIGQGANEWWLDVLENGPSSAYAACFDIEWRPLKRELWGKVLLPILGDQYGAVLESGELRLRFGDGSFVVDYYDLPLPIAPPTYPLILRQLVDALATELPPDEPDVLELQSIITQLERLPGPDERDAELIQERRREQLVAKQRLTGLTQRVPTIRDALKRVVDLFNGSPGDAQSFDRLDTLLGDQSYRLAFWRVAAEEINYRRFFAINQLAAIRQEEPAVFAATHTLLLDLLASGKVDGVRLDHPDGLWDPAGYTRTLQSAYARALGENRKARTRQPLYVVVEKILEHGEPLPRDWAVAGTVGYEFAQATTGLFVDPAGRRPFDVLYARFTGGPTNFPDLIYRTKHIIMRTTLASEVNVLASTLNRISEQNRRSRDFTVNALRDALREVIACFPVYRTYIVCEEGHITERDQRYINAAIESAKRRARSTDTSVFEFLRDVLLLRFATGVTEPERVEQCRFGMKFQQLTGPVMAKGLEDTAFFIYNRLTSLNEVGADPAQFGVATDAFHRQNADRLANWPGGMLTSSTHDTKRSEDVRARISVLSELPMEWRAALNRWARLNRKHKTRVDGAAAPDRNDEYLLYQTLLGTWPLDDPSPAGFTDRIVAFMRKATREAQIHTSWVNPNDAYEAATERFVRAILAPTATNPFLAGSAPLRDRVAHAGLFNALSQQLLKLTAPGVPDIYQGTELWDFSLVDPDNRRPVDFATRGRALRALSRRRDAGRLARDLLAAKTDGRIKLFLTQTTLTYRRAAPELFQSGAYLPLSPEGSRAEHVCAFARRLGDREAIVLVPRLIARLTGDATTDPIGESVWGETRLMLPGDPGTELPDYRNIFTGEVLTPHSENGRFSLSLAAVLSQFPVALLTRLEQERST